jgi:ankyrin repeat protein
MGDRRAVLAVLGCLCAFVIAMAPAGRARSQQAPATVNIDRAQISIEVRVPSCIGCPESRVTFRIGLAEFECLGGCAVPGRQTIKFSREQMAGLAAALDKADFFRIPREVGGCIDCGITTITYRDEKRIHEIVDVGFARLPALADLQSVLHAAAKPFEMFATPNRANYAALLDAGWKPNDTLDGAGRTMLNYAVLGADPAAVELLVNSGAAVNRQALEHAYSVPILEKLWKASRVQPASAQAQSLLWTAASSNWDENVDWLAAQGVDVNAPQPETGITPLMAAARAGYHNSFDVLIRHKARIDARDANGNQVLWYAAERDVNPGRLKQVLAMGVRVDALNADGRTALMHAAESCAAGNVQTLLTAGGDRNLRDKTGKTALDLVPNGQGYDRVRWCAATRLALER